MTYDGTIDIAFGMSAKTKLWKNRKTQWSELVERLKETTATNETYKEFMNSSKEDQSKIKDVGGYVGGYLRNGRRKPEHVQYRQLLTLDIDNAHLDFWEDFVMSFENAAVLHGTHKHSEETPRYRLVMPMDREATPDEYVAVARQIAGTLGIDLFDGTTFETNRLMFWPSTPKDGGYYFEAQDGPWISVDGVLDSYIDWTDSSLWPTASKDFDTIRDAAKKQQDPEEKRGIIGAFCRTYTVPEAIESFLSDRYIPSMEDRYTYTKGSTSSGLIVYDDKFAFSHHGTDPTSGKLCNAFDFVRIHLYGHLDTGAATSSTNSKSFKAMEDFAREDEKVRKLIAAETFSNTKYDFAEDLPQEIQEEDTEWAAELEVDAKGKYLSTASNLNIIFSNDLMLKGSFKQNDFDGKRYVVKSLPWRKVVGVEVVKNVDYSGVRNYIESIYGISGNLKIDDALALEFEKRSFHPIKEYLVSLEWDGENRINALLQDYFGVEDNVYTQEAIRKMFVGAVARVFNPGVKFDLVLTLVGKQGTGKSTFLKKIGRDWFSDTFMTVTGKEALEQIQGSWIIEMAELAGLKKAEIESVKHFISKQVDTFRPAYARTSENYPRQCIFVGTTNNKDFLRDPSGNRRFLPIDLHTERAVKSVFSEEFDGEISQLWAEAVHLFKEGESLYLSKAAEDIARAEQLNHSENDERTGLIEQYLDTPLPENWDKLDIYARRMHLEEKEATGESLKQYVCTAEIWCECLGKDKQDMTRFNTREINEILRGLEYWDPAKSPRNFPIYGKQKYYRRININDDIM